MRALVIVFAVAVALGGAHAWDIIHLDPQIFCTAKSSGCKCSVCQLCGKFPITNKPRCLKCAPGWRLNKAAGVCVKCKRAHCVKCNAATLEKCLQCKEGYKPNANGVCKPYCVEGKDGCAKCTTQGNKKWCSLCQEPSFIQGQWTIWYPSPYNTCHKCAIHDPSCHMCDVTCTKCVLCDDPGNNAIC
ncbi:hypothetical protein CHLNCDRAFT_138915 [Chlorella variabilis]|uniref:Uncharacterized protein n=1 Tax=Chlorella variabilis TaxID=554065 RepID=E1ZNX5_CHLVA|nr:hypothetical protein CHLNCDRAFT_138915 [Chlorella variabilis]EFN52515.1 hypothetical protein CHLNCDRAFT_138915 [Chlorella variabilis]|eukprot:XP_005844617.1 hypothetical protein CHLNCDRAFT_138915 [Chlorella variabilis]